MKVLLQVVRRRVTAIPGLLLCLFCCASAGADPSKSEREGRALVQELLSQRPSENSTHAGVLKIRDGKGKRTEIPVTIVTLLTATNWQNLYTATPAADRADSTLTVIHTHQQPNQYLSKSNSPSGMTSFAQSDFWFADLGLEFLHWPEQRLLKKELRRGEACHVLESINPQPAPGAYSRVVSWIDIDTGGIVHADAYGHDKKLLKVFEPRKFNKVEGRWQLKEMEIRNEQTDSRTSLIFDLEVQ